MKLTDLQRGKLLALRAVLEDIETGKDGSCDTNCSCPPPDETEGHGCPNCEFYYEIFWVSKALGKMLS